MGRADSKVLAHMRENGGILTRSAALALGMPSSTLQEWVKVGHLLVVGKGLYVLPGVLDSERTLLRAATHALDAIVSHESAARLHGLDVRASSLATVSVPIRRSNRFPGLVVHQVTDLTQDQTVNRFGMTTTGIPRTMIDLASVTHSKPLASLLDQAVKLKLATYEEVTELLESLARKGKPGVKKLRKILAPRLEGDRVSESTLETRLLDILVGAGLPKPATQFRPPWLRKVNGRVDLAYVEQEILIEGDSRRWHITPKAFQMDKARDNLAALAGWISLRYTWDDITKRPEKILDEVTQAPSLRVRAGYPAPQH